MNPRSPDYQPTPKPAAKRQTNTAERAARIYIEGGHGVAEYVRDTPPGTVIPSPFRPKPQTGQPYRPAWVKDVSR
jgi:hypothetical protein